MMKTVVKLVVVVAVVVGLAHWLSGYTRVPFNGDAPTNAAYEQFQKAYAKR